MTNRALEFDGVWKKFTKGERFDSLRDLIPAVSRRLARGGVTEELRPKEFWAVQDITFQVHRGEAVGIIGANGAGKSTVLKLISRIMQPTRGQIRTHGRLSTLIEIGAGFHPDLTGRENVYLNGTILGMKRREISSRFDSIVAFSGLEEFIDTPVKRYSSGMYARLGFSVAAHVDSDILLVDEVLSVGDWAFQKRCMEKMTTLFRSGSTIVFVSHNLRAVGALCQTSILLADGKVVMSGDTSEVIRQYMAMQSSSGEERTASDVYVSRLVVRNARGEAISFESGQSAWVDIEITARRPASKLAVLVVIQDQDYYEVFVTSTERLGQASFSMQTGETWRCTFEVTLHLAPGTYHVGGEVKRYDTGQEFDSRTGARTIYVHCDESINGVANLYPRVITCVKVDANAIIAPGG